MSEPTTTINYSELCVQDLICLTVCGKTDEIATEAWKALVEKTPTKVGASHLTLPARFARTKHIQTGAKDAVHDHPNTDGGTLAELAWTGNSRVIKNQLKELLKRSEDPQVIDLFE